MAGIIIDIVIGIAAGTCVIILIWCKIKEIKGRGCSGCSGCSYYRHNPSCDGKCSSCQYKDLPENKNGGTKNG